MEKTTYLEPPSLRIMNFFPMMRRKPLWHCMVCVLLYYSVSRSIAIYNAVLLYIAFVSICIAIFWRITPRVMGAIVLYHYILQTNQQQNARDQVRVRVQRTDEFQGSVLHMAIVS